nr:polysialyltransferase family glycosyltransferase [uncultured Flavobacterium sp.]
MKHVFYAHSHTLFLTALGTIEYLNLIPDDVIFIYTRNYTNEFIKIPYKVIDFSSIFSDSMEKREKFYFWKLNRLVKKVDNLISNEILGDYLAYLPHVGVFLPQVIATNRQCKGIRFVEEGTICYSSSLGVRKKSVREFLKTLYSFCVNQYKRYWFTDYSFYYEFLKVRFNHSVQFFGVSDRSFGSFNNKTHVVKWPYVQTDFRLNTSNPIYILEAAIEQNFVSKEAYLKAVQIMISESVSSDNYIKFHPAQNEENKNKIRQYFLDQNKNIIELPQNIPFELLMSQHLNLDIIGFGSSLLLYANFLNHRVLSYEYLLLNDSLYSRYRKTIDFTF